MLAKRILWPLFHFVFPPSCAVCGLAIAEGTVCADCLAELPWIRCACPGCGVPVADSHPADLPCAACQARPLPVAGVIAPLHYDFPIDAMLKRLKFSHATWIAPAVADLVAPAVPDDTGIDAIVPLPLHRRRHARRGFNQAAEIARIVGRRTGLPVRHCLRRVRATRPQSDLEAGDRRGNVRGAFRARGHLRCRHPLLVDDVMTTGETCRAAASALLEGGAERVTMLAIARASN